jgi:hypothetical protein
MNLTIKLISLIFKITVQTKYRMLSEPSFPLVGVITSQSISPNTTTPLFGVITKQSKSG